MYVYYTVIHLDMITFVLIKLVKHLKHCLVILNLIISFNDKEC